MRRVLLGLMTAAVASMAPCGAEGAERGRTPTCGYEIVAVYPHDPEAFTQGLVIDRGVLFEGTGLYTESSLRRVDLATGAVLQQHALGASYFGEGIAVVGDRIFQLTWQNQVGFIYDQTSFEQLDTFSFSGEGWGLTFDGEHLIRSNGSATLELWDPVALTPIRSVQVHDDQGPVSNLNELEFVAGELFANVWHDSRIARIDPDSGEVTTWLDLTGLLASQGGAPDADVLNGIAWDAEAERLFVTGKLWPWLFEISLPGCPIGPIFRDGFEAGDLGAWAPAEPPP